MGSAHCDGPFYGRGHLLDSTRQHQRLLSGFYAGGLQDLATILGQNDAKTKPNLVAPALVMKSWTYGIMTDMWGDIPYSQANLSDPSRPPAYDPQKAIYAGILADLK